MPSPYRKPRAHRRGGADDRRPLETPGIAPPPVPEGVVWPEAVRAWWVRVWSSPVASEWDREIDLETVRRLGDLYAAIGADSKAALHAQAAKLETELLLTPAARRRAHVRLPDDDVVPPLVPVDVPERWRRAGNGA